MLARRCIRTTLQSSSLTTSTTFPTAAPSLLRLAHTYSPPPERPTLGDCTLLPSSHLHRTLHQTTCPPIIRRRYASSTFTSDPNSPTPPPPSSSTIADAVTSNPLPKASASTRTPLKITNPRKDDNGNEMRISITPRAVDRLHHLMSSDPTSALRITVEPGGCHGFQYFLTLINLSPTPSGGTAEVEVNEEDTIFDQDGARVVIDESSLQLLNGSKVDYTMELIGRQFKVVDGPGVKSSCGCGTSFDVKI